MWIRSNEFLGKVHGSVQSSISKRQFGGQNCGWMGERSVPMTSQSGYSSAKSLRGSDEKHGQSEGVV